MKTLYLVRAAFKGFNDIIRLFNQQKKAIETCEWYTTTAGAYRCCVYKTTQIYDGEYDYKVIYQTYNT